MQRLRTILLNTSFVRMMCPTKAWVATAKQLLRNVGWLSVGNTVALSLGFVTTGYLARTLGQSRFGEYSYGQTLALYGSLIVDLGLSRYGSRAVARDPERKGLYLLHVEMLRGTSSILLLCVTFGTQMVLHLWSDDLWPIAMSSILWVVPYALNTEWFLLGMQRMRTIAVGRLVQSAAILGLTAVLVRAPTCVAVAPMAKTIGGLIGATWFLLHLRRISTNGLRPSHREALSYIGGSKWFWFSSILVQAYHGTDVLVMQAYRSAAEIGIYSAAFRLMSVFTAMINLVDASIFPMLCTAYRQSSFLFLRLRKMHLIIAGSVAGLLLCGGLPLAGSLTRVAYGDEFALATPLVRLFIVSACILTLNGALLQALLAIGYEAKVFRQILGTALVNVALNFLLVPRLGGGGSALAYLISVLFGTAWLLWLYSRRFGRRRGLAAG